MSVKIIGINSGDLTKFRWLLNHRKLFKESPDTLKVILSTAWPSPIQNPIRKFVLLFAHRRRRCEQQTKQCHTNSHSKNCSVICASTLGSEQGTKQRHTKSHRNKCFVFCASPCCVVVECRRSELNDRSEVNDRSKKRSISSEESLNWTINQQ